MFSLFKKKPLPISLEEQLETLRQCGVTLSTEATLDDLLSHYSREAYESEPFKELIPVLGFEIGRRPWGRPLCHRLWMCDYERISDPGSYSDIITRLLQLAEQTLPISNITDHVDLEEETAWVEFDLSGSRVDWDAKVDNDWLDPFIIVKFDQLLKTQGSPFRIYSNHTEFGQSAFFAAFTPAEFDQFQQLATFRLRELEKQV